jgi:hypothetical protein
MGLTSGAAQRGPGRITVKVGPGWRLLALEELSAQVRTAIMSDDNQAAGIIVHERTATARKACRTRRHGDGADRDAFTLGWH